MSHRNIPSVRRKNPALNAVIGISDRYYIRPPWWSAFDLQLTKVLHEWAESGRLTVGKGFWILTLFFVLSLTSVYSRQAYDVATYPYPGKLVYGQCQPYARELLLALRRIHAEAYLIRFHWKAGRDAGYHCVVLFYDNKKWYLVDNQVWRPRWIEDRSTLEAMIKEFDPILEIIKIESVTI